MTPGSTGSTVLAAPEPGIDVAEFDTYPYGTGRPPMFSGAVPR